MTSSWIQIFRAEPKRRRSNNPGSPPRLSFSLFFSAIIRMYSDLLDALGGGRGREDDENNNSSNNKTVALKFKAGKLNMALQEVNILYWYRISSIHGENIFCIAKSEISSAAKCGLTLFPLLCSTPRTANTGLHRTHAVENCKWSGKIAV
jgi:hypothetical protein